MRKWGMAEFINNRIIEKDAALGAKLLSMGMGKNGEDGVHLQWQEAAFLTERGLLEVKMGAKNLSADDLIAEPKEGGKTKAAKEGKGKEKEKTKNTNIMISPSRADQYCIYRSLRLGGRVVRFSEGSPLHWRVYERGVGREHERPQMLLYIVPPEWSVSIQTLEQQMQIARMLRQDLGLAFVRDGRPHMMRLSRPPVEG